MNKSFILRIASTGIAAVLGACMLNEAESNIALPLLPALSDGGARTYAIPEVRAVSILSGLERDAMRSAFIYQAEKGLATPEARQEQARGVRELLDFVNTPEFEQSLEWTGPIEGITPGMGLDQQADAYYGAMTAHLTNYSLEELELLQLTVAARIYTLIDLQSKIAIGADTVTENELDYVLARSALFREDVIAMADRRRIERLSGLRTKGLAASSLGLGDLKESLSDFKTDVLGEIDGFNKLELAGTLADAILAKYLVRGFLDANVGCGCRVKTGGGPVFYDGVTEVPASVRSKPHIQFWGDSLFGFMRNFSDADGNALFAADVGFYYPDYPGKIRNVSAGGSTSQDLRDYFDNCAGGQFDLFYPNPSTHNHIQLENQQGVLLIGGNDFLIYEPVLRAIPWLSIFRINHTLNNYNRIVSYHQAQNAQMILVSQTPRPVVDIDFFRDIPGAAAVANLNGHLEKVLGPQLEKAINWSPSEDPQGTAEACAALGGQCYSALPFVALTEMDMYAFAVGSVLKDKLEEKVKDLLFPGRGTDQTWLSMQTGALSLAAVPFVVQTRNVGWVNAWPLYMDPTGAAAGRWWTGNPALYLNDHTHYSHPLGQAALAGLITSAMDDFNWRENQTPIQGDRCDFTASTAFASGQPAVWTPEPPELPGATDETMLLIIICLLTGVCSL